MPLVRGERPLPSGRALRVLAVGQTPPPFGGQAIAIKSFVTGHYDRLEVTHVRMGFSKDFDEVGRFSLNKVIHLLVLTARILQQRCRTGADVLYYPPAGPDLVPVLRDIAVLLCTRWAFRATVFHFHAGGLSEIFPRLPCWLRPLFRLAYGQPALALQPSSLNPADGAFVGARRTLIVPNGVPDPLAGEARILRQARVPVILYAGVLRESKGLLVLVEACRQLRERGQDFALHLMGSVESAEFEADLRSAIGRAALDDRVTFLGTLSGGQKVRCFLGCDVFCYPSHFESETFGLVLLEAMACELPVVATAWRGVPSVVVDGETGFLVPIRDPEQLAEKLAALLADPELARRLGQQGRTRYLQQYTEGHYRGRMAEALLSLTNRVGE